MTDLRRKKINSREWYFANHAYCLKQKKKWRKANPDYFKQYNKKNKKKLDHMARERAYAKKYGITIQDYESLLQKQDGKCAICLSPPKRFRLAVDHDHKTGGIRGLLCAPCNRTLIGRLDDLGIFNRVLKCLKRG